MKKSLFSQAIALVAISFSLVGSGSWVPKSSVSGSSVQKTDGFEPVFLYRDEPECPVEKGAC